MPVRSYSSRAGTRRTPAAAPRSCAGRGGGRGSASSRPARSSRPKSTPQESTPTESTRRLPRGRRPSPSSMSSYSREDVPVEGPARGTGTFGKRCTSVTVEPLAVEAAERDAAALRAEVDGDHRRHQARPQLRRGARRRSGARRRRPRRGRRARRVTTSTPRSRQASTSSAGALVSVTIASTRSAGNERQQRAPVPLRPVEDADHALAGVRHLLLDPHLVRVQVHEPALEAQPAGAEEALVDPRRSEGVGAEVADERHARAAAASRR